MVLKGIVLIGLLLLTWQTYAAPQETVTVTLELTPGAPETHGYWLYKRLSTESKDIYKEQEPLLKVDREDCGDPCEVTLQVERGQTIHFMAKAVDAQGNLSGPSNEVDFFKATLPAAAEPVDGSPRAGTDTEPPMVSQPSQPEEDETTPDTGDPGVEEVPRVEITDPIAKSPSIELFDTSFAHQVWLAVDWLDYDSANGEARIASGDIDGDGRDEIVIGLGPDGDPAIPGGSFQVLDDDYTHLSWGLIEWPDYNAINGESRPSCGDIDGDGDDEILLGLGKEGQGKVAVFDFLDGQPIHQYWVVVEWPEYNTQVGVTRPAGGDLDGDGRDEIVIGLGADPSDPMVPGGLFEVFDDDYHHLLWGELDWWEYTQANGETFPALGDPDGDGEAALYIGLGRGGLGMVARYHLLNGALMADDWIQVDWDEYNQLVGETRPVSGDIDGDSRDELVLGLGNEPSEASIPGGLFQVLDETHAHLAWGEIDWQAYNAANGESYPATGDNDGDGQEEIIIGLGPKRMETAQDSSPEPASPEISTAGGPAGGCFVATLAGNR